MLASRAEAPARCAARYGLDSARSKLVVSIGHMGGPSRYGLSFAGLAGALDFDPADWRLASVVFSVDPRSVDASEAAFSRQVAGYFEPEKHPSITFFSTGVEGVGGHGRVMGDLCLHGVTRRVVLEVEFDGQAEARLAFSGRGLIRRSDFGLTMLAPYIADEVEVTFDVEFVRW